MDETTMSQAQRRARKLLFGLELTKRCNLACPHCFTGSSREGHAGPSRRELVGVMQQMVELGAREVAFSGGEPLLRKDLEAILADGLELGLERFSLVTNGSLVTAPRARRLAGLGLRAAQVSVDGADAQDHGLVRGTSRRAFYRALRGIRLLREAGITVDTATLLTNANARRLGEMLELGGALGVRTVRYCTFVPTGRAHEGSVQAEYAPQPALVDAFLERLRGLAEGDAPARRGRPRAVIDHAIGPWQGDGRFACVAGLRVVYITSEGDLFPCSSLVHDAFRVGNVYQTPLLELLARPSLHRVRRIRRGDLAEPCRSCENHGCSGGCRGATFAATGDLFATPPYCGFLRRSASAAAPPPEESLP